MSRTLLNGKQLVIPQSQTMPPHDMLTIIYDPHTVNYFTAPIFHGNPRKNPGIDPKPKFFLKMFTSIL